MCGDQNKVGGRARKIIAERKIGYVYTLQVSDKYKYAYIY